MINKMRVGDGVVEWWSGGVVEWWSGGVVEWWSGGVVEWWSGGEWWRDGVVERWSGGVDVFELLTFSSLNENVIWSVNVWKDFDF